MSTVARVSLAVLVSLGFAHSIGAQTVQGILVNEKSMAPIGNARLSIVDDSGRVADSTLTDSASGVFYLNAGRPGRYQVTILVGQGGLSYSPSFTLDTNQTIERKFAAPDWPREVLEAYLPGDVTKRATYEPKNKPPRYPDALRAAGRDGTVRAMVVVNRDGRAVMSTFRVIATDDDAFTRALRDFLDGARFTPAERNGARVPQIFESAADFGFGATPGRLGGDNVIVVRALGVGRRTPMP